MLISKTAKNLIEKYKILIQNNRFDEFFRTVEKNYISLVINDIANIFEAAGIVTLPYMYFIPEGYYMLSDIKNYVTPTNIREIHHKAFFHSSIETLRVRGQCTVIDEAAFAECAELKSVVLEEGVVVVDEHVFEGCSSLTYVKLPKSLKEINSNMFTGCSSLTQLTYDGTMYDWKNLPGATNINDNNNIREVKCTNGTVYVLD